jgi:hypothetical protein
MSSLTDCFFFRGKNGGMTKQQLCLAHHGKFPVIVTITPFLFIAFFK